MLRSTAIAAAILFHTIPVGNTEPMTLRVVTIDGHTGPAYYSAIEQGFRFVGGLPLDPLLLEPETELAMSSERGAQPAGSVE